MLFFRGNERGDLFRRDFEGSMPRLRAQAESDRAATLNGEVSERVVSGIRDFVSYDIHKNKLGTSVVFIFNDITHAQKFIKAIIEPILKYCPTQDYDRILTLSTFASDASCPLITESEMSAIFRYLSTLKCKPSNPTLLDRTQMGKSDVLYAGKQNWRQLPACKTHFKTLRAEHENDDDTYETLYSFVAEGYSPLKSMKIAKQPNGKHTLWLHFATSNDCVSVGRAWNASNDANSIVQRNPVKYSIIKDDQIFPEYRYDRANSFDKKVQTAIPIHFTTNSIEQNAIVVMLKWIAKAYELPDKLVEDICAVVAQDSPKNEEYQEVNWREIEDQSAPRNLCNY